MMKHDIANEMTRSRNQTENNEEREDLATVKRGEFAASPAVP